ncbi:MAG TPA: hypothetical protein VF839_03910 [Clostridium sp.]
MTKSTVDNIIKSESVLYRIFEFYIWGTKNIVTTAGCLKMEREKWD